eukprot:Skav215553  [mRNA]  locus=scaffold3091:198621:210538:- [translate_table: standard]
MKPMAVPSLEDLLAELDRQDELDVIEEQPETVQAEDPEAKPPPEEPPEQPPEQEGGSSASQSLRLGGTLVDGEAARMSEKIRKMAENGAVV